MTALKTLLAGCTSGPSGKGPASETGDSAGQSSATRGEQDSFDTSPAGGSTERYTFSDRFDMIQSSVTVRHRSDGSVQLEGITRHDYRPYLDFSALILEDVSLDAEGSLVEAEMDILTQIATTNIIKSVRIDAESGLVEVSRPTGRFVWELRSDLPIAYYHTTSDLLYMLPLLTPVAGWVFARAPASQELLWVDYDRVEATTLEPSEGRGLSALVGDEVVEDGEFVSAMRSGVLGVVVMRDREVDLESSYMIDVPERSDLDWSTCRYVHLEESFRVDAFDGTELAGVLDLPMSPRDPRAYIVLLSGTGGGTRDLTWGGVSRWRCLADALIGAGFGVARFDDRGYGETTGGFDTVTFDARTMDAVSVADWITERSGADGVEIVFLGFSEGGLHASRAAALVPEAGALVQLSVIGQPVRTALLEQYEEILSNYGFEEDEREAMIAEYEEMMDEMIDGTYPDETFSDLPVDYWVDFFQADGGELAAQAALPTAIFHGEADWQTLYANGEMMKDAVLGAGQDDVAVFTYPSLGHFLSPTSDEIPSCGDEYLTPQAWDDAVLSDLSDWLTARFP